MNLRLNQHRPRWVVLLLTVTLFSFLSACAVPGAHIRYKTKSEKLDRSVEVRAITPELIRRLNLAPRPEGVLQHLDGIIPDDPANYDYLVGRGDVLSIIVYDHPELTIPAGSMRSAVESGNVVHADGAIFYPHIGKVYVAGRTVREVRDEIQWRLADYIAKPQVDVSVAAFRSQRVYVTGQVGEPGSLPITNVPVRVLDAVSASGGLTQNANWHNVVLTRGDRNIELSVFDMLTFGDLAQNLVLKDGDVLHIPDVGNQQVYVMGEVQNPTSFGLGNSRVSLTNAVSQAGGIREGTANASGIFVIRRNPDNSEKFATVYQLNARNATAFVLGSEFMLQPSDVVYVTAAPIARWNRVLAQILPTVTAMYQATRIGESADNTWGSN